MTACQGQNTTFPMASGSSAKAVKNVRHEVETTEEKTSVPTFTVPRLFLCGWD